MAARRSTRKKHRAKKRPKYGPGAHTKLYEEVATYYVHPLDVWGNRKDGYEVNDVLRSQGRITMPSDATNAQVIKALKRGGFINKPSVRAKNIEIDGEEDLYVNYRGRPEYKLRKED
jgi:hypothetical protein